MNTKNEYSLTELNDNDRKILDKYATFYTYRIESNTDRTRNLEDERFKRKGD